jgi:arabinogalactan endo-1,4-beta-galactosidase
MGLSFFLAFGLLFGACKEKPTPKPPVVVTPDYLTKGADISWLPQMEATGYTFYDENGQVADPIDLLVARGINAVRLRVFVHPSTDKINGHCSPEETVQLALRAKQKGLKIMIDFHYSDTWADPAHQSKPATWANCSLSALQDSVYAHTYHTLDLLKQAGVSPKWVQIGNEIPSGFLWPEGHTDHAAQMASLLNKGYDACKAIDSSIQVIVHIDQGNDNARFRWFFDLAVANGLHFDIIGASYYPYWLGSDYTATIAALQNNLKDMVSRYQKPVMVVEVGGPSTQVQNTLDLLNATISATRAVPNQQGLGVFYWEPEGATSWSGYTLNCWQSNGRPSPALDAFLN